MRIVLSALSFALVFALGVGPALACGGFFCSQIPVEQRGEQIVFGFERGKVTAIIQIAYQGSAEDFAWVVPVNGTPGVALGPEAIFSTLRMRTDPSFYLEWNWNQDPGQCGYWGDLEMAEDGSPPPEPNAAGGVTVLDKQLVGPFETVTLEATGADVLLEWLNANDFDQPEASLPLIDHYLKLDMNFIAVKLQENATVGELQPLMLEMDTPGPCVPLVLTRIAAAPDMPVTLWTFGESRTIPTNWFGVDINKKKIDWLNNGANYEEVATAAIDEAAGHAFITEYANVYQTDKAFFTQGQYDLAGLANVTDPEGFLSAMLNQGFPRDAQTQSIIRQFIPKPAEDELPDECKTDQQFYTWNMTECLQYMPEDWTFDPQGFADALQEKVVEPLRGVQEMLDGLASRDQNGDGTPDSSYLTRLFSTVSPEEMTRDPMFDFNPDLGNVDNWHTAMVTDYVCDEETPSSIGSMTIEVDGESFTLEGPFDMWSVTPEDFVDPAGDEAAATQILLFGTSGEPEIIDPADVEQREQTLELMDPTHLPVQEVEDIEPRPGTDVTDTGDNTGAGTDGTGIDGDGDSTDVTETPSSSGGGGCQGSSQPIGLVWGLLLLALWSTRRRLQSSL